MSLCFLKLCKNDLLCESTVDVRIDLGNGISRINGNAWDFILGYRCKGSHNAPCSECSIVTSLVPLVDLVEYEAAQ